MITLTSASYTCTVQPATVKEEIIPIQTDVTALDGSMQRNNLNTKYQSTCTYSNLAPSDYQTLIAVINNGGTVSYSNTLSDYSGGSLSFTSLPTFKENEYQPGASLWRDITVVLREV